MSAFKDALEAAKIKITKYDPGKQRPVSTNVGTMDIRKFSILLLERLGPDILKFPDIVKAAHDQDAMEALLEEYAPMAPPSGDGEVVIPDELKRYKLNVDITVKRGEDPFFLTTEDEHKSDVSGHYYINKCKIPPPMVYDFARSVVRKYRPRHQAGIIKEKNKRTREVLDVFNTYVPAEWVSWKDKNPRAWRKLPSKPPKLLMKMLKHLIPLQEERKYLYAWTYASITSRSYVYLVLCGAPGSGKNRFKLVLSALHGGGNETAGKKSTLIDKFNSQLSNKTVVWFDELKYDADMENVMKEIQNDYLSIERKGVDATASSQIYTSLVISNNKPRDNYIAFDARKFAPLVVGGSDLKDSMSDEEIDLLSRKVDHGSPDFDVVFVAQIAKWILRVGKENFSKYPNLEYRGPMFWTLAHTSMTRWQKKAVSFIIDQNPNARIGWDAKEKAYQWSVMENKYHKRTGANTMVFPDYSSIRAFFDVFRDGEGRKAFSTKLLPGGNILGDFYIYPLLKDLEVITEATVAEQREKHRKENSNVNGVKRKKYDL